MKRIILFIIFFCVEMYASCQLYSLKSISELTCRGLLCAGLPVQCANVQNGFFMYTDANQCALQSGASDCRVQDNFDIRSVDVVPKIICFQNLAQSY